jgi:putative flippase GtrA
MSRREQVAFPIAVVVRLLPEQWRQPILRLFRFGTVGAIGFGVNEGLLYLLHGRWQFALWLAQVIAIESAIICNYLLNDRWTFHHPRPTLERFFRFNGVSLVSLVVNILVVQVGTRYTPIHYLAANAVGVVVAFGVNYLLNVYWAYGKALGRPDSAFAPASDASWQAAPTDVPVDSA